MNGLGAFFLALFFIVPLVFFLTQLRRAWRPQAAFGKRRWR